MKAVLALQKYHSTRPENKRRLFEENPLITLIIGLKKVPNKTVKPHRMLVLRIEKKCDLFVYFVSSSFLVVSLTLCTLLKRRSCVCSLDQTRRRRRNCWRRKVSKTSRR